MRAMESPDHAPDSQHPLSEDDVEACVRVLRAIEADRSHLTRLTREQRRELLTLAGLVAKPERHDLVRMAKAFRRAEREAAKAHDRKLVDQALLRVQRRSPVYAPLRLEPPGAERRRRARRAQPRARVLRLQAAVHEGASLLRFAVRAVRRLQLREARADGGSRRPLRARHGRAREDRLPGGAEAAARRRARRRHDALSRRRREPLREGAGLRASFAARLQIFGLDLRHTPSVELFARFLARAAAAARLHPEQRVPDGAAAGGILSPPARGRGGAARVAAGAMARRAREPRRAVPRA